MRIALRLLMTCVVLVAEARGPRFAAAEDADVPPSPGKRILVETSDGKQIEGKLVAIAGDSVRVKRGKQELSLATNSLAGVWTKKGNALGGLKAGVVFGASVGVLQGMAVPSDCVECDEERGEAQTVLVAMAANATLFGLTGLLVGAIDGRWQAASLPGVPPDP